ncbi:MAG: PD-(D/E)XK nuclease family protein [Nitrososphaera sp.]|nr:PD-(D/E)XK nuclease family protein [Nitrososphaera sp.]
MIEQKGTCAVSEPFENVIYDPGAHSYSINGKALTSISDLVSSLKPPFDREYWSNRKAEERGVEPGVILAEWEEKGRQSREKGNRVHEYIEQVLSGNLDSDDDPVLALNQPIAEMLAFNSFWNQARDKFTPWRLEWPIGDETLQVGGRADTVFFNKHQNLLHVFDWKTGGFERYNRFRKLLPPFQVHDDCEFVTYSIQLSLLRLIIERNTELAFGDSYIVHLNGDGFQIHRCLDFRNDCEAWLSARAEE